MPTFSQVFADAYTRIRVGRAGDAMNGEDADYILQVFNSVLDAWNGQRRAVYADLFNDYTLTPTLNPHTIGAGGTFNVTQRPESLDGAALNIGGAPNSFLRITVRDEAWYKRLLTPGVSASVVTDVYYSKEWPLGKLYFYPVPDTAYGVRLWTRALLAAVTDATQNFSLPPGYQEALTLELARKIAPGFGQQWTPELEIARREAIDVLFGNNDEEPRIATRDGGIPSSGGGTPNGFNWLDRSSV